MREAGPHLSHLTIALSDLATVLGLGQRQLLLEPTTLFLRLQSARGRVGLSLLPQVVDGLGPLGRDQASCVS